MTAFAIIEAGGHQHTVCAAQELVLNRLTQEPGAVFETAKVLALWDDANPQLQVGKPYVEAAQVRGTVLRHFRGPKVLIFKRKRRKGYRRLRGHRSELTQIRIDLVEGPGVGSSVTPPAVEPSTAAETKPTETHTTEAQR